MDKQSQRIAVQIAWTVSALMCDAEPAIDPSTEEGVLKCGEIVERVCKRFGLDPYME